MLDNRYALLFIRGERPVLDDKYDIFRHPNVDGTADGKGGIFRHGTPTHSISGSIVFEESINPAELPEFFISEEIALEGEYELLSEEDIENLFNSKEIIQNEKTK
jgi:type IV secretion system protein VirD4